MQYSQPLVSIALVTYQNAPFLAESIEAILSQTYQYLEIVISDDGSTDGSQLIIEKYAAIDSRIKKLISPVNRGISHNINQAFDNCSGEYICVIAGDDKMYPNKIEKQVEFLEANPDFDLCYHNVDVYDNDAQRIIYKWMDRFQPTRNAEDALFLANWYFKKKNRKTPSGSWFGRATYIKNGRNDPRTSGCHEFIFTMGMYAARPEGKRHTLPEVLGFYRLHSKSLSQDKSNWYKDAEEIGVSYSIAATKFPQYEKKIHNEEAYWWFIQLLYRQTPAGTYDLYLKYFIRRFGLIKYLYMILCRIYLGKAFSPLRKLFR
jgi:glycosyltransferase involved in cell wall biosynthesis